MKRKTEQPESPLLKRWTTKNLCESDYAFARSENGGDCLVAQLWKIGGKPDKSPWHLVAEILNWELFRELNLPGCFECKRQPYLEIPEHKAMIEAMLKGKLPPRIICPLAEIPLADVPTRINARGGMDDGTSLHAFEIQRYDDTNDTVAMFRKWLVSFKQTPDRLQWRAKIKKQLAARGALKYDADLRALAVRRLKLAGYNREQAESLLGLKKYALNPRLKVNVSKRQAAEQAIGSGTDQWTKLPAIADKLIQELLKGLSPI